MTVPDTAARLRTLHAEIAACRRCPAMVGPPVHGAAVVSPVLLIGQAPGPREASFGRPFAWTAGRTLFAWLQRATGADEARIRQRVYFAAVARCFPGKARGGGDRKPDPVEIATCSRHLAAEAGILRPRLVVPVGGLAIAQVTGHSGRLAEVVGTVLRVDMHGVTTDAIPLPHPSGASTWHRTHPGLGLLEEALGLLRDHPAMRDALAAEG